MDENNTSTTKDGDPTRLNGMAAPSKGDNLSKPKFDGTVSKKRRRGKYKRKVMKPFVKVPWQDRWKRDKPKRNNRFRNVVLAETQAPFNNNQFLMEIHKPEPENHFNLIRTPSARTRDSSFSIDSEDNYFYSLPEDEEEYLTKEFSSVYEDAQSERLSNMSKNELIQEYLLLEVKYENLVKRTERSKIRPIDGDTQEFDKESSMTDKDSMIAESGDTSVESSVTEDPRYLDILQRLKEQEDQLRELHVANEKLRLENEHLHQRSRVSSSEDSESDSSSTSDSNSSSSSSIANQPTEVSNSMNGEDNNMNINGQNNETNELAMPLVNGFHSPNK